MNKFHNLPYMSVNEVLFGLADATSGVNPYWGYSALTETRR